MYIHYSIDKDGNHLMQLPELNLRGWGRDKEEAHRNLRNKISGTVAELEAMARSAIGNIVLKEITINADTTLVDAEQFKIVLDVIARQGRANGLFNPDENTKRMMDNAKHVIVFD